MRYFLAALGLLLVGYLVTGITQVRPGERAVVRRFGRVVDVPGPGLYIGLPWGMDRVDRIRADQVRHVKIGYQPDQEEEPGTPPGQLLTGDHNLVNLQGVIDYTVNQTDAGADPDDAVVAYVLQADRADDLIARVAESVMAEWVAGQTVDDVLIKGKAVLPPWLIEKTQERLKSYNLGVQIQSASIVFLLPDRVRPAFEKVIREQTAIHTKENKARKEEQQTLFEADKQRIQMEGESAAYADRAEALARADAETFAARRKQYQELRRKNPDIQTSIWWDEMGAVFLGLKNNGRIDLLDNHIGADGLDITQFAPQPKSK